MLDFSSTVDIKLFFKPFIWFPNPLIASLTVFESSYV